MKKFLFMFLFVAAVSGAFTWAVAQDEETGEKKFVIHGEVRQRADYNDNLFDFSSDSGDSFLFFPYRARLAAEGHFAKNVIGYAEFQAFGNWGDVPPIKGGEAGPVDGADDFPFTRNVNQVINNGQSFSNDVELYQAYVALNKIAGTSFSLKVGRQEIVKGSEMLLGDLDFYSGISHDALVGDFDWEKIHLSVWWSRPLEIGGATGQTVPDHDNVDFFGAWVDFPGFMESANWSAYAMLYEDGTIGHAALPDPARQSFWTLGARTGRDVTGKNGFVWNAEFAYQTGDYNNGPNLGDTGSIKATGFEGMIGYNINSGANDHTFHVGYDVASGDDDPADDDAEDFNPLFQDYHYRYGLSDLATFSNLEVINLGYRLLHGDHSFGADIFDLKLAESGTGPDDLWSEVDVWWKYQYTGNTQIMAGLAWVDAGDVISDFNDGLGVSTDSGLRFVGNLRLRF